MRRLCTWLACAALVAAPLAAEEATLSLQALSEGPLAPGDTLAVGIYVDAGALELTSASAYLRCDPSLLQILSESSNRDGTMVPFASGAAWAATVYENAGDPLTGQLSFVAVSSADADGGRAVASGRFVLATVRLRVVELPFDGQVSVSLDAGGRRQSTYTLVDQPGVEKRFYTPVRALAMDVVGEGFVPLPDRVVASGQLWTVDLADYYSGPWGAVVAWGAAADEGIDLQREGSLLRAEAVAEGTVRYWVDVADGRRYAGQFAVHFVAEPVYMREGGLIEIDEDSGSFRTPLSEFMLEADAAGDVIAWAEEGAAVRVEDGALIIEPVLDWSGQTAFSLRFCTEENSCQTERWILLVHGQNDPPAVGDLPPLELVVGQRQVLPLSSIVMDVDDDLDALVFDMSESAQVQIVREGDALVVEALAVGDAEIVLRVVDRAGAVATAVWAVRVTAPSVGPQLAPSPDLRVAVGQVVTVDLSAYVEDVDSALEDLVWAGRGEGIDVTWQAGAGSTVELYAAEGGAAVLYVQVRDPQGNEATAAWPISIEAAMEDTADLQAQEPEGAPSDTTEEASPEADGGAGGGVEASPPAEGDMANDEGGDAEGAVSDSGDASGSDMSDASDVPALSPVSDSDASDAPAPPQVSEPDASDVPASSPVSDPTALGTADAADATGAEAAVDSTETAQDPGAGQAVAEGDEPAENGERRAWDLLPIEPIQIRGGASSGVDLAPYVEGIEPEALTWSVVAGPGVAVSLEGSRAVLQIDAGFYGRSQLIFSAVDAFGHQRSLSLVVEGIAPWSLGDIPDVELVQGDSLFIDLGAYVDADVAWSATGGEGLIVEWAVGGVLLKAETGFSGRSVLIFTAVDAAGYSAADAVRVEVQAESGLTGESPSATNGGADAADSEEPVELVVGTWGDISLPQGAIWTTAPLDELVLSGDAARVQWSLRGGAFVSAHIDSARRIVLNASLARIGREVFWLVAVWNDQRREVALGVQVGAREPTLSVPEGEVLATPDGYDLAHLVDGDASGVEWAAEAVDAQIRIEESLLFIEAEPGLYAVALAAHLPSGRSLHVDLAVRVPVPTAQEQVVEAAEAAEAVEAVVEVEEVVDPPQAPAFDMPDRIEVERGMGGRWPLRIVDGDSPRTELTVALASVGGRARLDVDALVVEDVQEAFYVVLQVRDAQGLSDSLRIDIEPRDTIPPGFELSAQVDGTGRVRWQVRGDEALDTALLLLDEQPLPHVERTERRIVWEHLPIDQSNQRLRVLLADAAGNVAAAQRDISVGWAGSGRAVHSADGQLRVLAGSARAHVLVYAEEDAYRIECADAEHLEVALRTAQTEGLQYGEKDAWEALPTVLSNGRLRAHVDGPGWLRSGGMRVEQVAHLAPVAFPNPFNAGVTIRLEMPVAGWLQVEVFDILGRRVCEVLAEERAAGPWTAQWDGRDGRARDVASGPYLIVVDAAEQRRVVPVLLLR